VVLADSHCETNANIPSHKHGSYEAHSEKRVPEALETVEKASGL